jgi:hypothetical protein
VVVYNVEQGGAFSIETSQILSRRLSKAVSASKALGSLKPL